MSIQTEFYTLLQSVSPAPDVYPNAIPVGTTFPAVQYYRSSSTRDMNFDEVENFVRTVMQVDTFAETYDEAHTISDSIRSIVNNYSGGTIQAIRLDFETDVHEKEPELFGVIQNYTVWHVE